MNTNSVYFVCGVESVVCLILIGFYIKELIVAYGLKMYKTGYSQSQNDDTKQLLKVCKELPEDVGNIVFKTLTGVEIPVDKKEESKIVEKQIGFTK